MCRQCVPFPPIKESLGLRLTNFVLNHTTCTYLALVLRNAWFCQQDESPLLHQEQRSLPSMRAGSDCIPGETASQHLWCWNEGVYHYWATPAAQVCSSLVLPPLLSQYSPLLGAGLEREIHTQHNYYYIPSSNLLFWNKQYLPNKGIELWNLVQTQVNMENGFVNILKFVICFNFQVMPLQSIWQLHNIA